MSEQGKGCPSCAAVAATWIGDCDNPIHIHQANAYIRTLETERADLQQQLAAVTDSFQAETLRTSMLAQLLLEFAKIYSVDHFDEPWPKACHRCDLLREAKQALELPVNTAWEEHKNIRQSLTAARQAQADEQELRRKADEERDHANYRVQVHADVLGETIHKHEQAIAARDERVKLLETVMGEVATMAGERWLEGQLRLADTLNPPKKATLEETP